MEEEEDDDDEVYSYGGGKGYKANKQKTKKKKEKPTQPQKLVPSDDNFPTVKHLFLFNLSFSLSERHLL